MPPHVYSDPYQDDFFMMRITFSQRAFYFQSPVFCCMALLSAGIASSRQRLHKNENTAYSFTDISGIRFLYISTTNSQRLQTVVQHLVRLFIHADHQNLQIYTAFHIHQGILHVRYKIRIFLWRDAPVFIHVGTQFVF